LIEIDEEQPFCDQQKNAYKSKKIFPAIFVPLFPDIFLSLGGLEFEDI